MFCGTDNIKQNILHVKIEYGSENIAQNILTPP
jgi:hypothetical protein